MKKKKQTQKKKQTFSLIVLMRCNNDCKTSFDGAWLAVASAAASAPNAATSVYIEEEKAF